MNKNVAYCETPWRFIFPVILLYLGLVIAGVYLTPKIHKI